MRLLQFEKFYTIDDFDLSAKRIRQHISDQANYEKIIEIINKKEHKEDPYFLFNVTMQSHGGYTNTSYKGSVETVGYTDSAVNQYLSLQKESDDALKYLIEYFEDYEEPTIIIRTCRIVSPNGLQGKSMRTVLWRNSSSILQRRSLSGQITIFRRKRGS